MRRFDPDTVENGHNYLFFRKRAGSIRIWGLHRHFLWVRLRILWACLMSLELYSMSVSRSTTNFDVVSMIGTIVFKGAECTIGNVKR